MQEALSRISGVMRDIASGALDAGFSEHVDSEAEPNRAETKGEMTGLQHGTIEKGS